MTTYVALLRGINVGGHKKIAMADLRALIEKLGLRDVRTYIQSGNVAFRGRNASTQAIAQKIERAIEAELAMDVTVMVRTRDELDALIANNPFAKYATDADVTVHVWTLSDAVDAAAARELCALGSADDELRIIGTHAYLLRRGGLSESIYMKLPLEKRLGVRATARKLNTLVELARIAAEISV